MILLDKYDGESHLYKWIPQDLCTQRNPIAEGYLALQGNDTANTSHWLYHRRPCICPSVANA